MVSDLVVVVSERVVAILTCGGSPVSSQVVFTHRCDGNLLGQNFADGLTLRHDVLVEMTHHVGVAVDFRWGLVLGQIGDSSSKTHWRCGGRRRGFLHRDRDRRLQVQGRTRSYKRGKKIEGAVYRGLWISIYNRRDRGTGLAVGRVEDNLEYVNQGLAVTKICLRMNYKRNWLPCVWCDGQRLLKSFWYIHNVKC